MTTKHKWPNLQRKTSLMEGLPTVSLEGAKLNLQSATVNGSQEMTQSQSLNGQSSMAPTENVGSLTSEVSMQSLEIGQPTLIETKSRESAKDYHSDRDHISYSTLRHVGRSLMHFRHEWRHPKADQTPAQALGSATHSCLLEPSTFTDLFVKAPIDDKRKKEWKLFAQDVPKGKTILKSSEYEAIESMVFNVCNHGVASKLLGAKSKYLETSIYFELMGMKFKCKPDIFITGDALYHVEIKTTRDASPKGFMKAISDYNIHEQMFFHGLGIEAFVGARPDKRIIVAIENEAPYAVGVYELDFGTMEKAEADVALKLGLVKNAIETDEWPGYSEEIESIGLPHWRINEH